MADMAEIPSRWDHDLQRPGSERQIVISEDLGAGQWGSSRRTVTPHDELGMGQIGPLSQPPVKKKERRPRPTRSEIARSRERSTSRERPISYNNPLHHFNQPTFEVSNQATPRYHLKKGKEKSLELLKNRNEHISRNPETLNTLESPCSADGSTASTSGSNSSSTSEAASRQPTNSNSSTNAMECDRELELHARQIRIELRKAEMIELALEAERAAASGQKSFAGRASTFGGDDESEIEIALQGIKSAITPYNHRRIRRTLDFGTPLRNRLSLGTPLVRRLSMEPSKISVKSLRDVSEVVPSFRDFHLHLRTHFLRRNVNKRSLVFEELDSQRFIHKPRRHRHNEQNDMMVLWNNFNFGSWTNASKRDLDFNKKVIRSEIASGHLPREPTDADLAELLAEHTHTPLKEPGEIRRPRIEVPPGLCLRNNVTFELQDEEEGHTPSRESMAQVREQKINPVVRTTKSFPPALKHSNVPISTPKISQGQDHEQPHNSNHKEPLGNQAGSPNSPIVLDDVAMLEDSTPDQKAGRLYQEPSLSGLLPLTPKSNARSVLKGKEDCFMERLTTPNLEQMDSGVPDFVTPVRLRDIRDNNHFGKPALMSRLPEAPLVTSRTRSCSITETPGSIIETYEVPEHPAHLGTRGRSLRAQMEREVNETTSKAEDCSFHFVSVRRQPMLDEMRASSFGGMRSSDISKFEIVHVNERECRCVGDSCSCVNCRLQIHIHAAVKSSSTANKALELKEARLDQPGHPGGQPSPKSRKPSHSVSSKPENKGSVIMPEISFDAEEGEIRVGEHRGVTFSKQGILLDRRSQASNTMALQNGQNTVKTSGGSVAGDQSVDYGCECLISPASSLDSEDGDFQLGPNNGGSSWTLMEKRSMVENDSNHQSLQAAVAMFSSMSPKRQVGCRRKVYYAASKDNDDFLSNYLYCSKIAEEKIEPEPICSGSAPCQDTKIPCGEVAVDSCIGNFLESALKFLPRKSNPSKLLSLSRERENEVQSKTSSWYDLANEKFDRLLESLMGSEYRGDDRCRLSYQAPILKERKLSVHSYDTPPLTPQLTPQLHDEVYDEDLGAVVYVQTAPLDMNASHSHRNDRSETGDQMPHHHLTDTRRRTRFKHAHDSLHKTHSDKTELRARRQDPLLGQYSM